MESGMVRSIVLNRIHGHCYIFKKWYRYVGSRKGGERCPVRRSDLLGRTYCTVFSTICGSAQLHNTANGYDRCTDAYTIMDTKTTSPGGRARGFQVCRADREPVESVTAAAVMKTIPKDGEWIASIEVKKSKFVAYAWYVESGKEAMSYIEKYGDASASHNCYAYVIGSEVKSSDDGEPGGTAGRPILGTIQSLNLSYVCVMVTRYFGGTKLGTGGLVRAYSGAAREVLGMCPLKDLVIQTRVTIQIPIECIGQVYNNLETVGASDVQEQFDEESGTKYILTFSIDARQKDRVLSTLETATKGKVVLID